MSGYQVFEKMRSHYLKTGQVMQNELFVKEIALKFDARDVIDGLMLFDKYLDKQRKDVS
ncbi:hypothetical protein [Bacillus smithii]|jgi:hypothetical protein|uniref:hypothetical protein n=1 Tax=Bacillus smithii TaxID=1479 RepID=UPI002E21A6E9|nr:hypothetical protein [Bacillus smithii]MED4928171.1 hypothetical protein [Bacillus smithii]